MYIYLVFPYCHDSDFGEAFWYNVQNYFIFGSCSHLSRFLHSKYQEGTVSSADHTMPFLAIFKWEIT